jgi:hypothetical protein
MNQEIKLDKMRCFYEPKMKSLLEAHDECVFGASRVQVSNKYIYILYYDEPLNSLDDAKPLIRVFDWDGNEISCYIVDNQIDSFDVTEDDKRIYCLAYTPDGEEYLGYFDLN